MGLTNLWLDHSFHCCLLCSSLSWLWLFITRGMALGSGGHVPPLPTWERPPTTERICSHGGPGLWLWAGRQAGPTPAFCPLPCCVPSPVQALCTSLQAAEPRLPSHLPQSLLHPMWSMGCSMTIPTPNPPFCLQGSRRWSLLAKKLFCKWIYFCMEKKVFFFKNSSFPLCPMQEALMAGSRLLGFLPPEASS